MTVHPITLGLNGYSQIEDYNIVNMQPASCININVSPADICSWITSKGGWQATAAYDIMTLVQTYLVQISLGFTVTMAHINGAIAYYLGIKNSGNNFTGCQFA